MALVTHKERLFSLSGGIKFLFSRQIFPVLPKTKLANNLLKYLNKIGSDMALAGIFPPDFEFFPVSRELAA